MPLNLNAYTAHICCDGEELKAYDVQIEGGKTVSCWIASEKGKNFSVHWGDESAKTLMDVEVFMDGRSVDRVQHSESKAEHLTHAYVGPDQVRRFAFAPLMLTGSSDDDKALHSKVSEELGTIRLTMTRAQGYKKASHKPFPGGRKVVDLGPVHERSKKAGVHAVALGEIETTTSVSYVVDAIGLEKEPFATFIFRYRPIELLRANGIVPLLLTPTKGKKRSSDVADARGAAEPNMPKRRRTAQSAVKAEVLSEDDDEEADRVRFLEEQMVILQRSLEEARAARRARPTVKREVSPICVPAVSQNEVIDLT
ncbi:hypothetical protein OH77DRAFT_1423213 [Trametes cingulata]|nr:hypothetical protein OH77DRAFT_1423213 [Trametes cingulata]